MSDEAAIAAALLAVDPGSLKGAVLRGPGGPLAEQWCAALRDFLRERSFHRVPPHVGADRLTGSLDVAATLKAGRPCHDRGLLAEARGGVLLLTSAERLAPDKAALIAAALDEGSGTALLALDEGVEEDERLPAILAERAAFLIDLRACDDLALPDLDIPAARARLPQVGVPEEITDGLCRTALALGIPSLRPALMALAAARAAAALDGRHAADAEDAALAARLILAPRARTFPAAAADDQPPPPPPDHPQDQPGETPEDDGTPSSAEIGEMLLEAVRASLPEGLLAALEKDLRQRQQAKAGAGAVSAQTGIKRGRPVGTRAGEPRNGARLSLIDTLRAAAPWQPLRRRQQAARSGVIVERGDFRIRRFKQKRETTAIFVVDASGSAALHRMAEAKGAVELILADCYVRRDRTALIAFRGKTSEILLPPTRSLQRAKKSLAELPGGGGTPLAAGIAQAIEVGAQVQRGGGTALAVFLTDGRANIARDGTADRAVALRDAETAARAMKLTGIRTLMIDLSDMRGGHARKIADAMGASYIALPHADSKMISRSVGTAMKAGR